MGLLLLAASSHSSSSGSSAPHAAPFRIVEDERGSGVVTVQCHVPERFLEVCALDWLGSMCSWEWRMPVRARTRPLATCTLS